MRTIATTYTIVRGESEIERDVRLEALVAQDSGAFFDSELCLVWTDETLAKFARLELDPEELVGCVEAIHEAHYQHECERCRESSLRQRLVSVGSDGLSPGFPPAGEVRTVTSGSHQAERGV